eukprot:TRINITY_DN24827_c0_g1_i1.p1 TRINITY_DN24827_c0_g1~~TRINITY_DN24827_c0_g1_i1.p1  ORF type:complete len:442 (+),score=92.72 TRINITY_DN24827_c0_g1_i1:58-1383(+)
MEPVSTRVVLLLITLLGPMATDGYLALFSSIDSDLKGSQPWIVVLVMHSSLLLKLAVSAVYERYAPSGRIRSWCAVGCGVIFSVASLSGSYSVHIWWLAIARVLQGASEAAFSLSNISAALCTPQSTTPSLFARLKPFIVVLSPVVGGVVAHFSSWRWVMRGQAAWGAVVLLLVMLARCLHSESSETEHAPQTPVPLKYIFKNRLFCALAGAAGLLVAETVVITYGLPFFLTGYYGYSVWAAGLLLGSIPLAAIVISRVLLRVVRQPSQLAIVTGVGGGWVMAASVLYVVAATGQFDSLWAVLIPGYALAGLGMYMGVTLQELLSGHTRDLATSLHVMSIVQTVTSVAASVGVLATGTASPHRMVYLLCNISGAGVTWYITLCGFEYPALLPEAYTVVNPDDTHTISTASSLSPRVVHWARSQTLLPTGTPPEPPAEALNG